MYTDDAGVSGKNVLQLETWAFGDKRSFQHWIVPTLGVSDGTEISLSGVEGVTFLPKEPEQFSYGGPILQGKFQLFRSTNNYPSWSIVGGEIFPFGRGFLKSPRSEYFFYIAGTSRFVSDGPFILHVNLGQQSRRQSPDRAASLLWGIAVENQISSKTHLFLEIANGDIYAITPGTVSQSGLRYELNPHLQLDGTFGAGLSGRPALPFWATIGFKVITEIAED